MLFHGKEKSELQVKEFREFRKEIKKIEENKTGDRHRKRGMVRKA